MEVPELRLPEEVDGQDERVADFHVVRVEEGASAEVAARHPCKLYGAQ